MQKEQQHERRLVLRHGLKNEIAILVGMMAAGFYLSGKKQVATSAAFLALGLKLMPSTRFSYANKSVVITGGSRGLGYALAEALLKAGALVTLIARDSSELKTAKSQLLQNSDQPLLTLRCDVTSRAQLATAFNKVKSHFGKIDILINNAGSVSAGPFESMDQKDYEAQMNLHFYAVLKASQLVLPFFKETGQGKIINISSIGGKISVPHMSAYSTSKFALAGFSQGLAEELEKDNIQVTTVYPGLMRTGSPVQAIFKGDHEKEFAWFAISDSTPGLSISARRAAKQVLEGAQTGQREVIISLPAKLGVFVHDNFPEIFSSVLSFANHFLPNGQSPLRQTGAASRGWIDSQGWAQPFLAIMKKAQGQFNEREKMDANFNLNLRETL